MGKPSGWVVGLSLAVAAPRLVHAEPREAPQPVSREVPARRGNGLYIAGGIVGGLGIAARIGLSVGALVHMADPPDPHESDPDSSIILELLTVTTVPGVAVGLGLLGGGAARHGRWQARRDLDAGWVDLRRARRHVAIGWALFGSGVALWGATRLAGWYGCGSVVCTVGVMELGYYPGVAMATAGMLVGPYGSSYAITVRRRRAEGLSLSPVLQRDGFGIALSGRF